jgi:hypothetical protein
MVFIPVHDTWKVNKYDDDDDDFCIYGLFCIFVTQLWIRGMYVYMQVCTYVCIYVCMYVCVCVCVCVYIYI